MQRFEVFSAIFDMLLYVCYQVAFSAVFELSGIILFVSSVLALF